MAANYIDRRRIEAVGVLNLDPTLGGRSAPLEFADDVADHIDEPVMSRHRLYREGFCPATQ